MAGKVNTETNQGEIRELCNSISSWMVSLQRLAVRNAAWAWQSTKTVGHRTWKPEELKTITVQFFHFTNEKTEAQEVNDLAKSPGKKVTEPGQEFRLPVSSSRIRTGFNKVKYTCYKSCGSHQDWKLAVRVINPIWGALMIAASSTDPHPNLSWNSLLASKIPLPASLSSLVLMTPHLPSLSQAKKQKIGGLIS